MVRSLFQKGAMGKVGNASSLKCVLLTRPPKYQRREEVSGEEGPEELR